MQVAIVLLIFCNLVFGYDRGDSSYFISLFAKDSTFKSLTVHDDVSFEGETSVSEAVVSGETDVNGPSFFGSLETLDAAVSSVEVENNFETGSLTISESIHGLERIDIKGNINATHLNTTSIVAESANIRSLETGSLEVEKNLVSGTVDITFEVTVNSIQTNDIESEFAQVEGDVIAGDVSFTSAQASYLSTTELTANYVEVLSFAATTEHLTSDTIVTGPAVVTEDITSVNITASGNATITTSIFASGDLSVLGFGTIKQGASASSAMFTNIISNSLDISKNATLSSVNITKDADSGSLKTGNLRAGAIYIEETASASSVITNKAYGGKLNASAVFTLEVEVDENSATNLLGSSSANLQSVRVKGNVGEFVPAQTRSNNTMTAEGVSVNSTLISNTVESITLTTSQVNSDKIYTGSLQVANFLDTQVGYVEEFIDSRSVSSFNTTSGDVEANFTEISVDSFSDIQNVKTNELTLEQMNTEILEALDITSGFTAAEIATFDSFAVGLMGSKVLLSEQKADFGTLEYVGAPHVTSDISYCYLSDYATYVTSGFCHSLVISMSIDSQLKVHHSPSGYVHTYIEDKNNLEQEAFLITCQRWPCHNSNFWWTKVPYYYNAEMKIFNSILHIYGVRKNETNETIGDFGVTWCNNTLCDSGTTSRIFREDVSADSKFFSDIYVAGALYFVYDEIIGKIDYYQYFNTTPTIITLESNTLVHPVVLPLVLFGNPYEIIVASPIANGIGYSLFFRACKFNTPSCIDIGPAIGYPFNEPYYIPVPSVRCFTGAKSAGSFVFGFTPKWSKDTSFYGQASAAYAIAFVEGDVTIYYYGSEIREIMSSTDANNDVVIGDNFVGIQAFSEDNRVTFALTHIHGDIKDFDDINMEDPVVYLPPIIVQCQTFHCASVYFVTASIRFTSRFTPTSPYTVSLYNNQAVIAGMPFVDEPFFDYLPFTPAKRISPTFQRIDLTEETECCNEDNSGRILNRNGVLGICTYYNTEDLIAGFISDRQTFTPFGKWIVHAKSVFARNMMENFLESSAAGKRSQPPQKLSPINFMEIAERLEEEEESFSERNKARSTNRKMASQIL